MSLIPTCENCGLSKLRCACLGQAAKTAKPLTMESRMNIQLKRTRLVRVLAWLLIAGALTYANTHTDWIILRVLTGMALGLCGWLLPDIPKLIRAGKFEFVQAKLEELLK